MNRRKGAAAVEFAIVAPLFFLLVFGMIEFGRAIMVKQVLCNATREGARLASVGGTAAEVQNCLTDRLKSAGVTVFQSDFGSQSLDEIKFGEPITIEVSVKFTDVSWLPPMYYNGLIEESTTMWKEGEE